MSAASGAVSSTVTPFRHEALLYGAHREFLDGTLGFLNEGLEADEPMLVVLEPEKIDALECELGTDASRVRFADTIEVGANPARIIPAWRDFADECTRRGVPFRGIGEPIWPGRSADELAECLRHEALLNVAFAETSNFRLLCPYDTSSLDHDLLEEARRSHHPHDVGGPSEHENAPVTTRFAGPLAEPAKVLASMTVDRDKLRSARALVIHHATACGLPTPKLDDLLIAVSEVVTNSILHGGGAGVLRIWHAAPTLVCEVADDGFIKDPLAGRIRPPVAGVGGRGLWLATQLCDLLQLRSSEAGSVIRLHMRTA